MATRVEAETTVGQALPSLVKDVSQRRIDAYSGVRPRSIHSDEAWARQKGFRDCLAQGMMSTAYASQLMVKLLGPGFARGGTMSMAFIKPVYAGDRLTVHESSRTSGGTAAPHAWSWRSGSRTSTGRRPPSATRPVSCTEA
jgi:acyl dehydratase